MIPGEYFVDEGTLDEIEGLQVGGDWLDEIVPKKGAEITPEAIRAHCETRLARFKCPSIIEVVPRLPHVSTGKVARAKLRDKSR
jgi:non-ribosomal peptide synthetase component E (peptide arylation enzyme)